MNTPENPLQIFSLAALLLSMAGMQVHAATQIGTVEFARGAVSAQVPGEAVRVLGKDSPVYEGDVITTGPVSFAVAVLDDGTRISIRPKSVFALDEYSEASGAEKMAGRLFKGGMRSITGSISKKKPDATNIKTSLGTIGIRGTEFDARLCESDCDEEAEKFADSGTGQHEPVDPGLYVACYDGHCMITKDEETCDLTAGQSGFVASNGLALICPVPIRSFQVDDSYLKSINDIFDTLYELLDDTVVQETEFECVVQ